MAAKYTEMPRLAINSKVSKMTTDEPLSAEALLAQEAAALETKWAELSDEALLAEIQKYKDAVTNLSTKLTSLGMVMMLKRRKTPPKCLLFRDHFQT